MSKKYKNKILLKNAECIDIKGLESYSYEAVNIIVKNTILIFFREQIKTLLKELDIQQSRVYILVNDLYIIIIKAADFQVNIL